MEKLVICNIPHGSSEADLQQWIEVGGFSVEKVEIIRERSTGQSRGFGFVVLTEKWKTKDAIEALDGRAFCGRVLTVNNAVPLTSRRRAPEST